MKQLGTIKQLETGLELGLELGTIRNNQKCIPHSEIITTNVGFKPLHYKA